MLKRALEKSPLFPYLAWTLIIGFSIFVSSLILELNQTIQEFAPAAPTINQATSTIL
jgi:hypothetical protein